MNIVHQRKGARMPDRPGLTVARIAAVARDLLVAGGLEAVTVRDVARGLSVSAPALYKHLDGRAAIVDELAAACLVEVTERVLAARDAEPPDDPRARMVAAGLALHAWARANPAEFALLFATPTTPFVKAETGAGYRAGLQLGAAFLAIAGEGARQGLLRSRDDAAVPGPTAAQLRAWGARDGLPMSTGELWTTVAVFQDLLGMIMVDVFGQVGFALPDTGAYMRDRLLHLLDGYLRTP